MNPTTSDDRPIGRVPITGVGKTQPLTLALNEVNGAITITVEPDDVRLRVEAERVEHFRSLVNQAANRATAAKERPQRSPDDLRKMLSHLDYELGMLGWSANKVRPLRDDMEAEEKIAVVGALESFLIHARNLYDFFYEDKKKQDSDVLAADFFEDTGTWKTNRPNRTDLPKVDSRPMIGAINKYLAHITWDRVDGDSTPTWPVAEILTNLKSADELFRNLVPREYRP